MFLCRWKSLHADISRTQNSNRKCVYSFPFSFTFLQTAFNLHCIQSRENLKASTNALKIPTCFSLFLPFVESSRIKNSRIRCENKANALMFKASLVSQSPAPSWMKTKALMFCELFCFQYVSFRSGDGGKQIKRILHNFKITASEVERNFPYKRYRYSSNKATLIIFILTLIRKSAWITEHNFIIFSSELLEGKLW